MRALLARLSLHFRLRSKLPLIISRLARARLATIPRLEAAVLTEIAELRAAR